MREVIVSVGMGPQQLKFIKKLKDQGYNVISFGKGNNSDEAKNLSDYSAEIDTRDFDEAISWIDSLNVKVKGVGSFAGGAAIPTVQKLSDYYNVSTKIPMDLMVDEDKRCRQRVLEKYNLSTIKTFSVDDINIGSLNQIKEKTYIIKPAGGRGSKGINFISKSDLFQKYKDGVLNKADIIQEIKCGVEYRCLIIVQDGEIKLLTPIRRKPYHDTFFTGELYYDISKEEYDRVFRFISKFVTDAKIGSTIIKADIIVSFDEINVIEMDIGVPGGNPFVELISVLVGQSVMDAYIKLITNQPINYMEVVNSSAHLYFVFNHRSHPIMFDLIKCKEMLCEKYGECRVITNPLHPEQRGGYKSNADVILNIICLAPKMGVDISIDDFVNKEVFE